MNKNFDQKNTVKYTHKGVIGRNNRRNASRYYENTIDLFSTSDYGQSFSKQKEGLTLSLFAKFRGDASKLSQLTKFASEQKNDNGISVKEALALRQNGWTFDRLMMRSRDKQYIAGHSKEAKHWGKRYEIANDEPALTLFDAANFLAADRVVNEPSTASYFKTADELQELGYKLGAQAKPIMTMDGVEYFDLTACKLDDAQFDIYPGVSINAVKLEALEDGSFVEKMLTLGNYLHMNIVDGYDGDYSAVVTKRAGAFGAWGHKLRASIRRTNTGVRDATTTKPFINYQGINTTPAVVVDTIGTVAKLVTSETFKEYRKTGAFSNVYKNNAQFIQDTASALLASAICRMGVFDDKDAILLSKVYRTNAAQIINDMPQEMVAHAEAIMDAVTQLYSTSMRSVANSVQLDFATFARQSGMEIKEDDLIFDQILCRPAYITPEMYSADLLDAGDRIVADMLARKEAENADAEELNANEAEENANTDGETDAQEATADDQAEDQEIAAQDDNFAQNEENAVAEATNEVAEDQEEVLLINGPKKMRGGSAQPVSDDSVIELPAAASDPKAKLETTYVVKDDFGFVPTEIDEKNKVLRKAVQKSVMLRVREELIKPVMDSIISEYSQDYTDTRQDDICSVIRKYNEWFGISQMSGDTKKEKRKEVIEKIDNASNEAMRTSVVSIEKALNLYKLTCDISYEVTEYKQSTAALADSKSVKTVVENFIKEYDGKETMQAELA